MKRCMALFCALALVVVLGCSGAKVKTEGVTGVVKMDGAPLADASVAFIPKDSSQGSPAYATTDAQGVYQLQTALGAAGAGAQVGDYAVIVTKIENVDTGKTEKDREGYEKPIFETKTIVPQSYGDASTTPFTYSVQKGKNTFDIDIDSSAK